MKIFITGGSGFIGSHIIEAFLKDGFDIVCYAKDKATELNLLSRGLNVCTDIDDMPTVDVCIHLAARVHKMHEKKSVDLLSDYRKVNVMFSTEVAKKAIELKVKKFIFFSSVKVYGNHAGTYSEFSELLPDDPYGISKYEAEKDLSDMFKEQHTSQLIVLRLPMVYGEGNKGNILSLLNAARCGLFMPLLNANNKRSFVYVKNIVSAVNQIVVFSFSGNIGIYNLTDSIPISTRNLYEIICKAMNRSARLFAFPKIIAVGFSLLFIKFRDVYSRLFDEYVFSVEKFCDDFNWKPPYSINNGIEATVSWYMKK